MATVIHRTTAGAAHDKSVRQGSKPASPFKHIVLLSSPPVTNIVEILALSSIASYAEVHRFTRRSEEDSDFPITEESATWTRFEPHLEESITGHITAIAILMDDGVLWGYAPYLPESNGLEKSSSFSWTLDLLVVESTEEATALQLSYAPLDLRRIREKLESDIYRLINEKFTARLCGITAAAIHSAGGCIDLPMSENQIIGVGEDAIVAEPILE